MRTGWALTGACLAACVSSVAVGADNQLAIETGETVYDRSGGTVGTIRSVNADVAVVDTGTAQVTLGLDSFRRRDGKLVLPMVRASLEAAAAKVQEKGDAEVRALLTPGATFYDATGEAVGTVAGIEGHKVTIEAGSLRAVLSLSAFDASPAGPAIRSTRAEFLAKLEASRPMVSAPDKEGNPPQQ